MRGTVIIIIMVVLAIYCIGDSFFSYKKGVFKEYRKMAPYIYHYRGEPSFIFKIVENALLGLFMLGCAIWLWFKIS